MIFSRHPDGSKVYALVMNEEETRLLRTLLQAVDISTAGQINQSTKMASFVSGIDSKMSDFPIVSGQYSLLGHPQLCTISQRSRFKEPS